MNALLYGVPSLPEVTYSNPVSTLLPESGYAYLRQGKGESQTYVAFDSGKDGTP